MVADVFAVKAVYCSQRLMHTISVVRFYDWLAQRFQLRLGKMIVFHVEMTSFDVRPLSPETNMFVSLTMFWPLLQIQSSVPMGGSVFFAMAVLRNVRMRVEPGFQ